MITSDELSQLRKRGASDADILSKYREYDSEYDSDIDTLLKRGEAPGKILDGLARFGNSGGATEAPSVDKMANKGVLAKTTGALQYGAANLLAGLSSTARRSGFTGTADALQSGSKTIAPADYEAAGSKFDVTSPSTYGYAPRALLEGAPGVVSDLAAGALGGVAGPAGSVAGFMASNAARNFGPNVDARMEHQAPGATPETSDYLAAGAGTAAEALLSRVGINPAISSVAKGSGLKAAAQVPGLIAKATGAEAASGAAGDVVNQVARTAGTQDGLSVDPKEAANAGALSGATGGAIRAARGVGDVTNAARFRGIAEDAAARVVARLDRQKADTSNPEKAYQSVDVARKTLDTEINDANQVLRPTLKSKGNDTDTDSTRILLKETLTTLKAGEDVPYESLTKLKNLLGETQEGNRLVSLLEERQAMNRLTKVGRFEKSGDEPDGYFAGGLLSDKRVDSVLNPMANFKLKLGLGATAGIAELPMMAQLGINGTALAKLAALQAGAYTGVRALDAATGMRNPAKEFMTRFRGEPQAPPSGLPSFRQEAEDAKALAGTPDPIKAAKAKAKQEDKAWKAQAEAEKRAEAADARKQDEIDKAYATRDPKPGAKESQEDALWRAREAERTQEANDDATASQAISEGYSSLLERAVKAGEASRKLRESQEAAKAQDVEKASKVKAKQDAEEAKRQAEADKAWASREGKPGPSEDDLWAANEKAQASDPSDLEVTAGIQSGYKELAARAKKAQELREAQIAKAEKQRDGQDAREAKTAAGRKRDFSKAEAERNRPDPQRVKAAQENSMWQAHEDGTLPNDWSDADAISAIQRETKAREKSSSEVVKESARKALLAKQAAEKASKKPKGGTSVADVGETLDFPGDTPALQIKVKPKASKEEPLSPVAKDVLGALDTSEKTVGGATTIDKIAEALPQHKLSDIHKALYELQNGNYGSLSAFSDPKSLNPAIKAASIPVTDREHDNFHMFHRRSDAQRAEANARKNGEIKRVEREPEEVASAADQAMMKDAFAELLGDAAPKDKPKENVKAQAKRASTAQEALKKVKVPKEAPNPEMVTITHRGQTVERPRDTIDNLSAYSAKTRRRMETRHNLADDLADVVGPEATPVLNSMLHQLNNTHRSFTKAWEDVEAHVMQFPDSVLNDVDRVLKRHKDKIRGTYSE